MPSDNKTVHEQTLRDKPLGYSVGIAVVSVCPVCQQHGARVSSRLVLHTVRYVPTFANGSPDVKLDETDACKLSAALQRRHPRRVKVEQTEWCR